MKVIDLFCGAGGSSLGAKLAGHEVLAAYDWDSDALKVYKMNHPDVIALKRNILDLEVKDLPWGADILMGSTPCEGFSMANCHGRDCDMTLMNKFLELVDQYKPKYWIMENVPQVKKYLKDRLPEEQLRIHLSAKFGVPQMRRRLMAGNYPEPVPTHSNQPFDLLPPYVPFRKVRDPDPKNWSVMSCMALKGVFRRSDLMAQSGNRFHTRVIGPDDVMPTVVGSDHHGIRAGATIIYEGGVLRRITFLEMRRIQSFPDSYLFEGTVEKKYKLVGQAVPPLLMKACLKGIGEERHGEKTNQGE